METENKFRILSNILKTPLLRNFLITSLVISAIFPLYSVFYIIPSFNMQLTANMEDEALRTASHLRDLIIKEKAELTKGSLSNENISEIKKLTKDFRLEKLQIFSKQGEIIFSTTPNDIGKTNKNDYFQNVVAKGNVYTKVVQKNTKSLEDRIVMADVVETYVPLLSKGAFIGAFEIYYDITARKEKQVNLLARIYAVLFAIILIFLITVIFILFKSSKNILERDRAEEEKRSLEECLQRAEKMEEKRSLEERLNRAEKMEALGILAGGVAHDLNNVLGIVVGYAELLLLKASESSAIRPPLVKIMKGGQKAAAIVHDLLTLARRGVPGRDVLNLNSIISDCQKSPEFEQLYSYHSAVKIKTELEPDLPNISGSSVHLGKTIFNLVSNASEAMPKGGVLTIKTTNQYLDKPIQGYDKIREGEYVVLSVSDTGEGIPASDLKRIFEPFYTKKVMGRSGTGLGLAVVWGTVKDNHGYINVQSEEGKGSTFTLYFPVTREELSAEHVAVSISEYMGKGESILIVDDVNGQRDLAAEMLRKLNYSVTSASSGEEAVAYLKEHKADLMVLDMIMDPGMDGLDTYRSVLEIRPKQKAIIVSGFSESERVHAAQTLGAGAYVKKPYVIEKLGMAVRKELDRAT